MVNRAAMWPPPRREARRITIHTMELKMLKAVIDKLEDVAEPLRQFYTERNGKFELKVEGMKTEADVARVQTALDKERTDHTKTKADAKAAKDKLVEFADLDPHEVTEKLAKLATLEAAGGGTPDQAKIDALVNQRVEAGIRTKVAPLERELKTTKEALTVAESKVGEFTTKDTNRTIDDAVRDAAVAAKVAPSALNDFVALARTNFTVAEDGKVVTKDGLDAKTFVSDQKQTRAHFWTPATGAGANGNNGGVDGGVNPFKRETWNMTEQGKLVTTDRAAAERLAVAAGTTIGGGMPPAPPAKAAAA
jgi:hypothetical protein